MAQESLAILNDSEKVYDLAGKRLALRCLNIAPFFDDLENPFRLGIIGPSNRGKTTFTWDLYSLLLAYWPSQLGILPTVHDLDIFTNSLPAAAGIIKWKDRKKNPHPSPEEERASIAEFRTLRGGIIIADVPGKLTGDYTPHRVAACHAVVILVDSIKEIPAWRKLTTESGIPAAWLISDPKHKGPVATKRVIHPTVFDLNREPRPFRVSLITTLTRILEMIARSRNIPLLNIWSLIDPDTNDPAFSKAERILLQEYLDFYYAPFTGGEDEV